LKTSEFRGTIVLLVLLLAGTLATPAASRAEPMRVLVLGVIDGQTFNAIDQEEAHHRVRIEGIAAPSGNQFGAAESRSHLNELIHDNTLRLDTDHGDSVGRLIAQVNSEGTDIGLAQIKAGMARYNASQAGSLDQSTRDSYLNAERAAHAARLGLWSGPNAH
jgi:endonuclease YncB( thermonuclease family)